MILSKLCGPALIYLIFSMIHIVVDASQQNYKEASVKFFITVLFTLLLQLLCIKGMSIASWVIVFIPFIFYTYMVSIIHFVFGQNPSQNEKVKEYLVN
jgi:hypothetical protein